MPLDVSLDRASATAASEQLRAQVAAQIAAGALVAGERLPTVRALAQELGLAANTVAKAYRELETAGLVATNGRAGTLVSAAGDRSLARVQQAASRYAELARELGVPPESARRMVEAALEG